MSDATREPKVHKIPVQAEKPKAPGKAEPQPIEAEDPTAPAGEAPMEERAVVQVEIPADELARLRQERDDYLAMSQRAKADLINYQTRSEKDAQARIARARQGVLRDLLQVADNLERALQAARESRDFDSFLQGIQLTRDGLMEVLKRFQVEVVDPKGKPFDVRFHEAFLVQPTDEVPPNTVLEVFEKGYRQGDEMLRPARVSVSKAPLPPAAPNEDEA